MKLIYDDAFCTVDDECPLLGHIGKITQIDDLLQDIDIVIFIPVGIPRRKPKLCLQGYGERDAPLSAFLNRILGRIDVIFHKLQKKIFSRIADGKKRQENFLEPLDFPLAGRYAILQEISKRL